MGHNLRSLFSANSMNEERESREEIGIRFGRICGGFIVGEALGDLHQATFPKSLSAHQAVEGRAYWVAYTPDDV